MVRQTVLTLLLHTCNSGFLFEVTRAITETTYQAFLRSESYVSYVSAATQPLSSPDASPPQHREVYNIKTSQTIPQRPPTIQAEHTTAGTQTDQRQTDGPFFVWDPNRSQIKNIMETTRCFTSTTTPNAIIVNEVDMPAIPDRAPLF